MFDTSYTLIELLDLGLNNGTYVTDVLYRHENDSRLFLGLYVVTTKAEPLLKLLTSSFFANIAKEVYQQDCGRVLPHLASKRYVDELQIAGLYLDEKYVDLLDAIVIETLLLRLLTPDFYKKCFRIITTLQLDKILAQDHDDDDNLIPPNRERTVAMMFLSRYFNAKLYEVFENLETVEGRIQDKFADHLTPAAQQAAEETLKRFVSLVIEVKTMYTEQASEYCSNEQCVEFEAPLPTKSQITFVYDHYDQAIVVSHQSIEDIAPVFH